MSLCGRAGPAGRKQILEALNQRIAAGLRGGEAEILAPCLGALGLPALPAIRDLILARGGGSLSRIRLGGLALTELGRRKPEALWRIFKGAHGSALLLPALKSCQAIGPPAGDLGPAILKLMQRKPLLRKHGLACLGRIRSPKAIPHLKGLLLAGKGILKEALRHLAGRTLGRMGGKALPALLQGLQSPDASIQKAALAGISELGPGGQPALTRILPILRSPDRSRVFWAVSALSAMEAFEALLELDHFVPGYFAFLLPALLAEDARLRTRAVRWFVRKAPEHRPVQDRLLRMIRDPEPGVRFWVAAGLARARSRNPLVKEALVELGFDWVPSVRMRALRSLGKLRPGFPGLREPVLDALEDRDPRVAREAAVVLGSYGSEAACALPALEEAARSGNASLRDAAREALQAIRRGP